MDTVYKAQPYVDVVGKNENTLGLDVVHQAQPFVAAYNNRLTATYSSLPTNYNADLEFWILNGGSASSGTLSAMNTFCNSINSAGLRDKFYRLNLFCGNNLTSCLLPIYFGQRWNSFPYGFANGDRNFNFITGDYTESGASGGLLGDGSTKYLDTGVTISQIGTIGHVSCYHKGVMSTSGANVLIRGSDGNNGIGIDINAGINLIRGFWSPANTASFATNSGGHYLVTRTSSTSMVLYTNGATSRGDSTNTTSVSFPISSWTLYVFALNNVGVASSLCPTRIQGYSIGTEMTQSEANSFYTIMQTFQTALGRNQ
jgi:hypothetical protein